MSTPYGIIDCRFLDRRVPHVESHFVPRRLSCALHAVPWCNERLNARASAGDQTITMLVDEGRQRGANLSQGTMFRPLARSPPGTGAPHPHES